MKKILMLLCIIYQLATCGPTVGDSTEMRIWFSSHSSTTGDGVDSRVVLKNITSGFNSMTFKFLVDPVRNSNNSSMSIPMEGISFEISISNQLPNSIIRCSSKFLNGPWITAISSNFSLIGNHQIFFPLLPPDKEYENKDWYRVKISDSLELYCEYMAATRAFTGSLISSSNSVDNGKNKNGQLFIYTRDNPFRLGVIVLHSNLIKLIDPNFKDLGTGYYGLTMGRYMEFFNDRINQNRNRNIEERKRYINSREINGRGALGK